jgi:hypothetical protein
MSGGRGCAGLKRKAARNKGRVKVDGRKMRRRELGGHGQRRRVRYDDRPGEMHDRANRAVVVGCSRNMAIRVAAARLGLIRDLARAARRGKDVVGMDVRERQRQLQQQREQPEGRAETPYRSKGAHPAAVPGGSVIL